MTEKKTARITAVLILVMAAIAPVCMMYVPSRLIDEGSIPATMANIQAQVSLFRLGITCEVFICLLEIVISVLLYRLFKSAYKTLALISASARFAMAVLQGVNALLHISVLMVLNNHIAAEPGQGTPMVFLLLQMHKSGVYIWQILFGFHLLTLGILVYLSGYMPKYTGIVVFIASLGYLADSYAGIWGPASKTAGIAVSILLVCSTIGELLFTFQLLIKGIRIPEKFRENNNSGMT